MHVASGHSNDSTQLENLLTKGPNEGIPPIYKNQKIKKKSFHGGQSRWQVRGYGTHHPPQTQEKYNHILNNPH